MPTYRVHRVPIRPLSRKLRYPLVCECCGKTLGQAGTPAELDGLSVGAVLGLWPDLRATVEIHETVCAASQAHRPRG
jgi:hypothetical protein